MLRAVEERGGGTTRVLILVALVLGVAGVALGIVSILDEGEQGSEELALTLTVQEGEFKVNDVAPPATSEEDISSGDSFVFTGAVSGDREGKLLGACEVADVGEPTCQVTYTFDDGHVTGAGVPDFSQQAESFEVAVTGGTAAYDGASGQVDVHENGQATHEMTLVLPEDD
jgi:hypothetical protein